MPSSPSSATSTFFSSESRTNRRCESSSTPCPPLVAQPASPVADEDPQVAVCPCSSFAFPLFLPDPFLAPVSCRSASQPPPGSTASCRPSPPAVARIQRPFASPSPAPSSASSCSAVAYVVNEQRTSARYRPRVDPSPSPASRLASSRATTHSWPSSLATACLASSSLVGPWPRLALEALLLEGLFGYDEVFVAEAYLIFGHPSSSRLHHWMCHSASSS
uniref:Uncharacterized protein n=1 Tax=Aegilops tauschii TaxID=37682 RepID=R7W5B0_AEGTA